MSKLNKIGYMIGILGLSISTTGCVTEAGDRDSGDADDELATASSAETVCRRVQHFDYVHDHVVFHWNVTTEIFSGRQFVDEREVGGPLRRQFTVSPRWSLCPVPNEIVRLRSGSLVLIGSHNCLDGGREEYHGSDYQRLLVPVFPFTSYNCDP